MDTKAKSVDKIDECVGKRLRLKRGLLNLSQTELGDQLGVSRIKIGQYEAGTRSIPASHLFRLTEILKVNITYFFDSASNDETGENDDLYEPFFNKEAVGLIRDFQMLGDAEVRKAFAGIMERTAQISKKA